MQTIREIIHEILNENIGLDDILRNPKYDTYRKEETGDFIFMAKVPKEGMQEFVNKVITNFNFYRPYIISGMNYLLKQQKLLKGKTVVKEIELQGSILTDKVRIGSDIDILVLYEGVMDEEQVVDELHGKIGIPGIEGACDIQAEEYNSWDGNF